MSVLKTSVSVVMVLSLLSCFAAIQLESICVGAVCEQETADCGDRADCIQTLNICRLKCQSPNDYACLINCDPAINSEYRALISCARANGCSVDPQNQGALLFAKLQSESNDMCSTLCDKQYPGGDCCWQDGNTAYCCYPGNKCRYRPCFSGECCVPDEEQ